MEMEMEKTIAINLTKKEIEALQISIIAEQINLKARVECLENLNKSGINTKSIQISIERIKDLDNLWDKLSKPKNLFNNNHPA